MGGPGSGGFRGYGWPPGSSPGPSQSSSQSSTKKRWKPPRRNSQALKAKRYRKNRGKTATVREKAMQEARRISKVRKDNVLRFPKPREVSWRKFRKSSRVQVVVALHDTLPLWIRGQIKEFSECGEKLVLLNVETKPVYTCEEVKPVKGWPRKIKELMAVPLKDLWIE